MSRYIQGAIFAYAAATALLPFSSRGHNVAVPPNSHAGLPSGAQLPPAGNAPYGHQNTYSDPSAAYSEPPMHQSHGYVAHDHSVSQGAHDSGAMGAPPNQFTLWEQSAGSVELLAHSWHAPLTQDNLSHWDVAMSTIPSEDHVVLMPGDANRTGQFWHRNAVPAVHFEVQFGFGVFGKDQATQGATEDPVNIEGRPDGFAFWYVYEPYASVYPKSPEEQASWSLLGYKSNPKGFGVAFKAVDREGRINPSISCIHNTEDGRELLKELPNSSAFFYQYRNKPSPVLFRVIVGDQGVVAQLRESVTSAWVTACTLDHVHLHPHGFIGFTGHNGSTDGQIETVQQHTGDQVVVYFVKMWSLDPLTSPQNGGVSQHAVPPPGANHISTEPHAHPGHVEHYGVFPGAAHAPTYASPSSSHTEQTILRLLTSIGNQISMLSVELNDMRHDIRKHWGDEGSKAVKSLQSELTGFKDLFKRHSQQHASALNTIHKHVETKSSSGRENESPILSRLTDLSSQLEKDFAVKHAHSFLLSMAALALVVLFALCSWRKFRDIEKKHML